MTVDVCSESQLLPTDLCPTVVKRLFRSDEVPTDTCDIHVPQAVFMPNVVGMSLTKAKKALAAANLNVKTVATPPPSSRGRGDKQDHSAGKARHSRAARWCCTSPPARRPPCPPS